MKGSSIILLFSFIIFTNSKMHSQADFTPPSSPKMPVTDTEHGFKITDDYRWLENKDDPKTKDWSHLQHNFTLNYIKSHYPEIKGLKDEIRQYLDRDIISSPFYKAKREFFYAKKKGEQQSKLYTRINGKEIKIFDPEEIDPSGKTSISAFDLNKDGSKAAVGVQFKGNEINDFRIIDTETGKVLGDIMKNVYGFSWCRDENYAYISIRSKEIIEKQVPIPTYLHKIGDNMKNDQFLFAPADAKDHSGIWDDEDTDLTYFSEGDFYSNTLKLKKSGSNADFKTIFTSKKFTASANYEKGRLYIYTNYEAPNYKLMIADPNKPEFEHWKTFYPEAKSFLQSYAVTSDFVIIQDKADVLSRLSAYSMDGKFIREIKLPELASVAGIGYRKEDNCVYVSLNSFSATTKIYKLNGKTLEWEFFYQDKSPLDTKDIIGDIRFYYSKDSTKIPIFIIHKKDVSPDGNNPTILYGYGGFNIAMSPGYVGLNATFINRGGVYAIACLRGGNEYGENWHLNGMLLKKQNVFDDFIAAAEYLINEKFTNPNKLAIKGGSNGGLLVGAVEVQRPDLFKAVFCAVPLLDMLRYHKFLIARFWIPEYGDPDKKSDFLNIMKYSPYNNIRQGINYPTTLVKAGENDARVDPLHAKKFVAAMQNNPSQKNPFLLFIDFDSGHGSGQSIDQQVENISLDWRFLMGELGVQ